jgi:phosphoglycerate dehydrogenase-like enzyme
MTISVWIRDRPQREAIGPLPPGIELNLIPSGAPFPEAMIDAEFLVPPFGCEPVLELMRQMPRLAVVHAISAGTDGLEPWVPEGVTLCSARGTRDNAVAEWVLAAILAMYKRLPELVRRQSEHRWKHELLPELAGGRALIVGYGSIGGCVATKLAALGMQVRGVASTSRPGIHGVHELADLLPGADVVVVLVPLTQQTRGLLGEEMLSRMRPGSLLVNASRGPVLDTEALVEHLRTGRLLAALDVTEPEPLPVDHPLWDAPGLLVSPHLAGDSPEAEERVYRLVGDQIRRYAAGEPLLNVVGSR